MKNWKIDQISTNLNNKIFNYHDTSQPLKGIQ